MKNMIEPKKYLGLVHYSGKCSHPAITRHLTDNEFYYGVTYECLICRNKFTTRNDLEDQSSSPYVYKTFFDIGFNEKVIIYEFIKVICTHYKDEQFIDIAKLLKKLDPEINETINAVKNSIKMEKEGIQKKINL